MLSSPRGARVLTLLALSALLAGAVPVDAAGALDCIRIHRLESVESLTVRASPGREIEVAVESTMPGEGIGFVMVISPTLCTGLGLPSASSSSGTAFASDAPAYPALA